MERLKLLKNIREALKSGKTESLELSLNNVHAKGLFSLVVLNKEFGKLTRVFVSENEVRPFDVQLHTHRYPIRLTVLKGLFRHHVAKPIQRKSVDTVSMSQFDYKSFLNGGTGLSYETEVDVFIEEYIVPAGSTIEMNTKEFHTVSCSAGAIWIVEELGFETESSKVLGIPFIADSLYTKPEMFQVNDKAQLVLREVNDIIRNYELI